jgi:hypothetical protein
MLLLTNCQTTGSGDRSVACETFKPIYWNKADTRPTIRQIVGHNATGKALCSWKPK